MICFECKNGVTSKGVWADSPSKAAIRFVIWFAIQEASRPGKLYKVEVRTPGKKGWTTYHASYESFYVEER